MPMVSVRERCEEDLGECVAVLHKVYEKDAYPQKAKDFRTFLVDKIDRSWVAIDNGDIVGHVGIGGAIPSDLAVRIWKEQRADDDNIAVVKRLFVSPNARNKGVAAALIEAATSWAESVGTRLILFVLIKDQAAMRLYRKLGWKDYGTGVFPLSDEKQMDAVCFANPSTGA